MDQMIEETRATTTQLLQKIRGDLLREIELAGPGAAIMVCKYSAMENASALARSSGWSVSRVSLKPRNPTTGTPDAWEQTVLAEFERRAASGEKAESLEEARIVKEPMGRYFRYMKALPVQPVCLSCHGPQESLTNAVKQRLLTEYPHDRATGYQLGQVRGAVSIKRPL